MVVHCPKQPVNGGFKVTACITMSLDYKSVALLFAQNGKDAFLSFLELQFIVSTINNKAAEMC